MNHAPHLYFAWQQLVEKSQLMLRLATEGRWDELIASEMEYVNAVQKIAHLTEEMEPSAMIQEQLRPMLRLVLENENKVKQLLQIRMDELAKLVGQSSKIGVKHLRRSGWLRAGAAGKSLLKLKELIARE